MVVRCSFSFPAVIYAVISVLITVAFMCFRENYGKLGADRQRTKKEGEERELLEDSFDSFSSTDS